MPIIKSVRYTESDGVGGEEEGSRESTAIGASSTTSKKTKAERGASSLAMGEGDDCPYDESDDDEEENIERAYEVKVSKEKGGLLAASSMPAGSKAGGKKREKQQEQKRSSSDSNEDDIVDVVGMAPSLVIDCREGGGNEEGVVMGESKKSSSTSSKSSSSKASPKQSKHNPTTTSTSGRADIKTTATSPAPAPQSQAPNTRRSNATPASNTHNPASTTKTATNRTNNNNPSSSLPFQNEIEEDDGYYKHWVSLQSLTAGECESSEIAAAYGCEAIRHHRGQKGWAGVLGGGTIGMFDTKEEAIKRVVCAAMVMDHFDTDPNKATIKTPLSKSKKARSRSEANKLYTTMNTKNAPKAVPVTGITKLGGGGAASVKMGDKANPISISSSSSTVPASSGAGSRGMVGKAESGYSGRVAKRGGGVSLGKRKWKTRDADGKIRHCEMSDIDTGHILEVFRSCSQAERETKISRTYIGKVCRHGGGILDGRYFRFVYLSPDEVEEHISKKSKQADKSESFSIDDDMDDDDGDFVGTAQSSSSHLHQHHPDQRAGTYSYKLSGISGLGGGASAISGNAAALKHDNNDYDVKMGAVRNNNAKNQFNKLQSHFDLSFLQPLKKKLKPATRPKKLIELVDLSTGKVVVNFRGNADAGQALNMDRKKVGLACQSYGRKDEITYGTFQLRYAKNGTKPVAYEYGAHEIDYQRTNEAHEERKIRFQKMFEADQRRGGGAVAGASNPYPMIGLDESVYGGLGGGRGVIAIDSTTASEAGEGDDMSSSMAAAQLPSTTGNGAGNDGHPFASSSQNQTNTSNMSGAASMVRVSALLGEGNSNSTTKVLDGRTLVTTRKPSTREIDSTCVICQERRANVVFEPCLHCVVCASCVEKGCCSRFCPSCRLEIDNRTQPSMVHLIRPRIYSAYSFM